jgi:endonuclease/exonuclease/phosphatase family metal-dependent hydrolase
MRIVFFLIFFGVLVGSHQAQNLRVLSFNIRYDNPADGLDAWSERKTEVALFLSQYELSVIGMQEVLHHQLLFLDSALTDFDYVGVGRDDGNQSGEYAPIFYNTTQLDLIESGTFWLSSTPDTVSKGWDAALPRICTWCKLRIKLLGLEFVFLNTHFDHIGKIARENASKLILEKINVLSNQGLNPVILCGDFNAEIHDHEIEILTKELQHSMLIEEDHRPEPILTDSGRLVQPKIIYSPTFNGFKSDLSEAKTIDHIFTKKCDVLDYHVCDEVRMNGRFLSDHFAVMATLHVHLRKK